MSVTTDPARTSIPELAASTSAGSPARHVRLRWVALHFVPLLLVPLLTTSLGPVIGLDGAAIATHAATIVLIALGEGTLLERISVHAASKRRAMLAVVAAIATAMIVMSTVDRAGYDLLATPVAMTLGGLAQGIILGWPVRRVGAAARWAAATALGWLAGAGAYRLALSELLALEIGTRSLYGYAYTGGHNELLWIACGIACFGLATAFVVHPASRNARRA